MIYNATMKTYLVKSCDAQWTEMWDRTSEYEDVERWYLWMSLVNGNIQTRMHIESLEILQTVEYSEELLNEWIMCMVR